jgi:WD40 repeat protein
LYHHTRLDDQIIQLFDFEKWTGISQITPHNFLFCVKKTSPIKDLLITGSLDSKIRIVIISNLFQGSSGGLIQFQIMFCNIQKKWITFHDIKIFIYLFQQEMLIIFQFAVFLPLNFQSLYSFILIQIYLIVIFMNIIMNTSEDATVWIWDIQKDSHFVKFSSFIQILFHYFSIEPSHCWLLFMIMYCQLLSSKVKVYIFLVGSFCLYLSKTTMFN